MGKAAVEPRQAVERRRSGSPAGWSFATERALVRVASQEEVDAAPAWRRGFLARARKDRRYYRVVEQTLPGGRDCAYFVVEDLGGRVRAVQPFFVRDLDLLHGIGGARSRLLAAVRRVLPRFAIVRAVMVGCLAGEGHLDRSADGEAAWVAEALHDALLPYARAARARLVVLKEFPSSYRETLSCFSQNGFARVPSFPMTRLSLGYESFDDFLRHGVGRSTRKNLRRKLRAAEAADPITLEVTADVQAIVEELYPLYLQVYDRARFRFEQLTPEFLGRVGRELPEKVRFFVWRQRGRVVAFSLCMLYGDTIYDEYLGLDYTVALELGLYFYTLRDIVDWGIRNGYRWYCSTALAYEPKRRLRSQLVPLDLYVAHTSKLANAVLRRLLPLLEPTHRDATLRSFPEYQALWK